MDLLGTLRNRRLSLLRGKEQIEQDIRRLQFDLATQDGSLQECEYWLGLEESRCANLTSEESAREGEEIYNSTTSEGAS